MLKMKSQKGFTIVELLIVIVVIGILAALVLNTFSGVQKRARDTQRQTDINAVATQLEVYYNDKGGYPLWAQIDTQAEVKALLKGVSDDALIAPGATAFSWTTTKPGTAATSGYTAYYYVPAGCTASNDSCTSFVLSYVKEDNGGTPVYVDKNSLN